MNSVDISKMGGAEARSITANADVLKTLNEFNQRTNVYVTEFEETSSGWWRKWSNGLIEQGGVYVSNSSGGNIGNVTLTLLKPFSDTNYSFTCSPKYVRVFEAGFPVYSGTVYSKEKSTVRLTAEDKAKIPEIYWYASGF